jgi:hypothetical protein
MQKRVVMQNTIVADGGFSAAQKRPRWRRDSEKE